jgi:peroxiredoxin
MHKQVRFEELDAGTMRSGREKGAGSLNTIPPSYWKQPSFSDFLNNLFVNTLSTESKTLSGSKIKQWISRENITDLLKWVQNFTGTTPPLTDLILLKMLHDAYYSGEFQGTNILRLVRSDHFRNNREPEIRTIAQKADAKLSFLRPGTPAPEICLSDLSGKQVCSTENTKPFLYVLFADLEIPVCREHVKYLKTMAEKTGPGLQMLLIVSDSKNTGLKEFVSVNRVPGIVVTDTGNEAAKKYAIRSFPSAFLLDKTHKVVLAPARTPLDGFEFQFAQFKK